jgi:hypothetical protein
MARDDRDAHRQRVRVPVLLRSHLTEMLDQVNSLGELVNGSGLVGRDRFGSGGR